MRLKREVGDLGEGVKASPKLIKGEAMRLREFDV